MQAIGVCKQRRESRLYFDFYNYDHSNLKFSSISYDVAKLMKYYRATFFI